MNTRKQAIYLSNLDTFTYDILDVE